jgi:undecaprenyl-diphosphatase
MSAHSAQTLPARLVGYISQRDSRITKRVHRWHAPHRLRVLMFAATRGGDGWLWYGVGLLILLFGGTEKHVAVVSAGLSSGAGLVVYLIVKRTTRRQRPCAPEPHCWARLVPPDQYSFPSGHTITAFAVATSLSFFYPALPPPLFCFALCIAASRIILGMHFLSDVVAGTLIGVVLAYGTRQLTELACKSII